MARVALFALLVGSAVAAAPVPPESDKDKVARLWGKVHAPEGDYTVKPEGKLLTLRTFGWPLRFGYTVPEFRVTRDLTGDFDVRVKLMSLDAPNRTLKYEGAGPQTAAGLVVAGENCGVCLYHWMAVHKDRRGFLQDGMQDCVWLGCHHAGGGSGSYLADTEPGKSLHLRVVRKGKAVNAHTSSDGKDWKTWPVPERDLKLPDAVTVGIFVGQTTTQECAATFAEFTVGKPE